MFGDDEGMADIAVAGPLAGVVASPLIAVFAVRGGASGVFVVLASAATIPLMRNRGTGASDRVAPRSPRSRPVRAAIIILAALGIFTLGGSAVFQLTVVVGTSELGLSTGTIAAIFTCNAVASIPASRWPWRRGIPGPWMAATGACAVVAMVTDSALVFAAALTLWGFGFWMAIPGAFTALAERSANPSDRAGDAQAIMAGGRVLGPFVGGAVIDNLGTPWVGVVGGGMMIAAGAAVFAVRAGVPPREPADGTSHS